MKYEIGQKVWIQPYHRRARPKTADGFGLVEGTVEKIGRTLVHVRVNSWSPLEKFDLRTGFERGDYPARLTTPEKEAERAQAEDLRIFLSRRFGLSFSGLAARLPLADLQQIEQMIQRIRAEEEDH